MVGQPVWVAFGLHGCGSLLSAQPRRRVLKLYMAIRQGEGEKKSIYAILRSKYVLENSVTVRCIDRGQLNLLGRKYITNRVVQTVSFLISIISVL